MKLLSSNRNSSAHTHELQYAVYIAMNTQLALCFSIILLLPTLAKTQILFNQEYDEHRFVDFAPLAYFNYGDSIPILESEGTYWLDTFPKYLIQPKYMGVKFIIQGNTDYNEEMNLDTSLSLKRALWLKAYYLSKGIKPERIIVEGARNRQPKNNCNSPGAKCSEGEYQMNRRVEVMITSFE